MPQGDFRTLNPACRVASGKRFHFAGIIQPGPAVEECMSTEYQAAVLAGSLRKESINRKVAKALTALAPPQLKFEFAEIGHLPLYNQDLDENPPAAWSELRDKIRSKDAVLFVTP